MERERERGKRFIELVKYHLKSFNLIIIIFINLMNLDFMELFYLTICLNKGRLFLVNVSKVDGGCTVRERSRRCEGQSNPRQPQVSWDGGRSCPFLFLSPARLPIPTSQNRRTHTKAKGRRERGRAEQEREIR